MKRKLTGNLLLLAAAILIGLAVCELVARILTETDKDGQVSFKNRALLPYRFPDRMVEDKLDYYFQNKDKAYVIDDGRLGWTVAPNRISENGLYQSNSRGIRSAPYEYSSRPEEGVLRVALFGDSFTHGDEVDFFRTWGYFLERDLIENGVTAEVLNFGVGGYGIGQAYLRWKLLGGDFHPDIAVFGFQGENMQRTVNIIRSLYSRNTWLVFSKPRLILDENDTLKTVNFPVIPPRRVPRVLDDFDRSPLARYEFWYNPENYRDPFWLKSRFFQIIYNRFRRPRPDYKDYTVMEKTGGGTPEAVSLAILKQFAREAEEAGAFPIILHIPKKSHLKLLWKGETPAYYSLFRKLKADGITVVDPAGEMKDQRHLYLRSHFSPKGGKMVARFLADAVIRILSREGRRDAYQGRAPDYLAPKSDADILREYRDAEAVTIDLGTPLDHIFIQKGFHHRERHLGKVPVRWSGPIAVLSIPVYPRPGRGPVLDLRVVDTGPPRKDWSGRVIVEMAGEKLGEIELLPGEKSYRLPLKKSAAAPEMAEITISASPWQPSKLNRSRDTRNLGVMLDRITLSYE